MENKNMKASFSKLLEKERKSLSLSLPSNLLSDIDELCEALSSINGKPFTRQSLIETGLTEYVADFKEYIQKEYGLKTTTVTEDSNEINTLIVPAHADGIITLLKEEWYWLRIGKEKIDKIKYLAVYFGSPTSAITHIAKVDKLEKHPSGYKALLSEVTELDEPVKLGDLNAQYVRPNRYVSRSRVLNAHEFADLVDFE